MPFGRSDAGFEPSQSIAPPWFSACARSGVSHVVSTRMCRRDIVRNRHDDANGDWHRVGAAQPAREPYRHIGPSHAAMVLPSPSGFFPVLYKAWYRNAGARSLSPVAAGNQVLAFGRPAIVRLREVRLRELADATARFCPPKGETVSACGRGKRGSRAVLRSISPNADIDQLRLEVTARYDPHLVSPS
jgi:hypothetical protein